MALLVALVSFTTPYEVRSRHGCDDPSAASAARRHGALLECVGGPLVDCAGCGFSTDGTKWQRRTRPRHQPDLQCAAAASTHACPPSPGRWLSASTARGLMRSATLWTPCSGPTSRSTSGERRRGAVDLRLLGQAQCRGHRAWVPMRYANGVSGKCRRLLTCASHAAAFVSPRTQDCSTQGPAPPS